MGQPALEAEVEILASPNDVWAALSDVSSMKKRSPELVVMRTLGKPQVGRRTLNLNRRKGFAWPTSSRITRWKPPTNDDGNGSFAFSVWPTNVEWSYDIEPTATGDSCRGATYGSAGSVALGAVDGSLGPRRGRLARR